MTAADEGVEGGGVIDFKVAVAARAAALKALGFEEALRGLLEASSQRGGGPAAAAAAAGASSSAAGAAAPAAAGVGVGEGVVDAQDLVERVQTALEQLRIRGEAAAGGGGGGQ